jgi:hypothetical protein
MPEESWVSDATILSVILELSITILEVSFTLTYNVYCAGITYDDLHS